MKQKTTLPYLLAAVLLTAFVLWTVAVCTVDVAVIGPRESTVGFSAINNAFHKLTGVHMSLYVITDWLGLVPIAFCLGFAILGLCQWIGRKRFLRVDHSILVLGGFYLLVMASYITFEYVVINHRPVLIDGYLEASYPSSTTLLVLCVMPTAIMQLHSRIRTHWLQQSITWILIVFTAFMIVGRLISGVHWLSDIFGGALLSAGLVALYYAVCNSLRDT